ncbi:MAG: ABC transporter permease [Paracoccaceae bacterium]
MKSRTRPEWILLTIYCLIFFAFIYLPLGVVIVYSFNSNPFDMTTWQSFTLDWYLGLFGVDDDSSGLNASAIYIDSTDQILAALRNSLIVATSTTFISTLIGTATAVAMSRFKFRLRNTYQGVMMLPMMMPDIVLGIGLLIFFVTLGFQLGLLTIIIGHCTFLSSYVFIVVQARMSALDPALEEASADLGANEWVTFKKVLLPQLMPGIIGGALLAFIISMDDLVITYFVAGTDSTTLPMFIFSMIRRGVKPEINAIATLLILASLIIAAVGLYIRSRKVEL